VSVVTLVWSYFLSPDRGLLAPFLANFGIGPIAWLSDPSFAMAGIIITTVWWTVGFNLVLFAAGLQDIDESLYEAAALDGAGPLNKFWNITIPGLKHVLVLVIITQIISSFQVFGQVNIMTGGGPGGATRVLIQHIYEAGFRDLELGYASAVSLFLFAVMLVVSIVQLKVFGRER
jgi:multiple sugar transport system permease protein